MTDFCGSYKTASVPSTSRITELDYGYRGEGKKILEPEASSKHLSRKRKEVTRVTHTDSYFRRPSSKIGKKGESVTNASSRSGWTAVKSQDAQINKNEEKPTTVGFIFKGKVFLATDHSSKSYAPNIFVFNSHMLAAISGGSRTLLKFLPDEWQIFKRKVRGSVSVARASKFMTHFLSSWGEEGLPVQMLIGGLDEGGPALYHVTGEGKMEDCTEKLYVTRERPEFVGFATGYGAKSALAAVHFKLRNELSAAEVAEVAKTAICYGVRGTPAAGNFVSVYQVDSNGWTKCISGYYVTEWIDTNLHYDIQKTLKNQHFKVTSTPHMDSHFCRPSSKIGEKGISVSSTSRGSGQTAFKTQDQDANINDYEDCSYFYCQKGLKGPTILGFIFKGEVFLATDHFSKSDVRNVIALGSHMLAAISGGSEIFLKDLREEWQLYQRNARGSSSVETVSKWISRFLSSWGEEGLPVGMLIGGLDEGGPALYHVDGKGKMEDCIEKLYATGQQPEFIRFAIGRGALGALAVVHFGLGNEISAADAAAVAKAAICYGVHRAAEFGSFVSVYQIVPEGGWTKCIADGDVREWKDTYEKTSRPRVSALLPFSRV